MEKHPHQDQPYESEEAVSKIFRKLDVVCIYSFLFLGLSSISAPLRKGMMSSTLMKLGWPLKQLVFVLQVFVVHVFVALMTSLLHGV